MATIGVQTPALGGSVVTLAPATAGAGGDIYFNTGKEMPVVLNGSGAPITVTFKAKHACDQGVLHDLAWSVAAGAQETHPPVDPRIFNDPDTGMVQMVFSAVVTVTVGVLKAN